MPRADHRDARNIQNLGIAADVQRERGIVDLLELLGKKWIVEGDDFRAHSRRPVKFLLGERMRLAGENGLCRACRKSRRLQVGERGVKDGLGTTEKIHQVTHARGPEPRG